MSVPFATVSTYSDRSGLSIELDEKLVRQHNASPRAVAVVGLSGTGKTQSVAALHRGTQSGIRHCFLDRR